MILGTMSPSGNPFQAANFGSDYTANVFPPTSPASTPYHAGAMNNNALVVYNPTSLYGLWFNEQVHGPFATGLQANPFVPGLSPVSTVPKPAYATDDPLRARYPAARSSDDPLNWITEDLFNVNVDRAKVSEQRRPLRGQPIVGQ